MSILEVVARLAMLIWIPFLGYRTILCKEKDIKRTILYLLYTIVCLLFVIAWKVV